MNASLPIPATLPEIQKDSTVFTSGNSQAVRIPKEFQLKTKQVKIIQRGADLVIKPKYKTMGDLLANLPPIADEDASQWDQVMQAINENRKEPLQERDWANLFGIDDEEPKIVKAVKAKSPLKRKAKV
jgi:antitoxin VapB